MAHAHALERIHRALLPLGRPRPAIGQRKLNVFEDRQIADEVETLKDETDLAVAYARPVGRGQLGDRLAVQDVLAVGRRVQQAQDREQSRLAAAGGTRDGHELALLDLEMNA